MYYLDYVIWLDKYAYNVQEVGCGGMKWIDLAKNRDSWQAFIYAAMKLRVL